MKNITLNNCYSVTPIIRNDRSRKHRRIRNAWLTEICKGNEYSASLLAWLIEFCEENEILVTDGTFEFANWYFYTLCYVHCPGPEKLAVVFKHLASLGLITLHSKRDLDAPDWIPGPGCDIRLETQKIEQWLTQEIGWKLPSSRAAKERRSTQAL